MDDNSKKKSSKLKWLWAGCIAVLIWLIRGLVGVLVWQQTAVEAFLSPLIVLLIVLFILFVLCIIINKNEKVGRMITKILLVLALIFLALCILLCIVGLIMLIFS